MKYRQLIYQKYLKDGLYKATLPDGEFCVEKKGDSWYFSDGYKWTDEKPIHKEQSFLRIERWPIPIPRPRKRPISRTKPSFRQTLPKVRLGTRRRTTQILEALERAL